MSSDAPYQYVPLDKLKIYQNNTLFNTILRRLNFSNDFALEEVPGTDSVDISLSSEVQPLSELSDVSISSPLVKQFLRYDGSQWKNDYGSLDDLSDVTITSGTLQSGHMLRYDATTSKFVNTFPFLDDLVDVVSSNPQSGQAIRYNGINYLNAYLSASDLSDVEITSPVGGEVLRYDGSNFVNVAVSALNILLDELADVIITSATTNQFLGYNGSNWVNALISLNTLSDVSIGSLANKQVLQYNGSNWANILAALTILNDVNITSPSNGQVLQYSSGSSKWINATPTPGVVNLDDLGDVTISSLSDNQILVYDSGTGQWKNETAAAGVSSLNDLSDVTITAATSGDILRHNGSAWVDVQINELLALTNLSDVSISGPSSAHVLRHNGSSWTNSLLNLTDLTPVTISSPSTNQVLQYNGSTWVNATLSTATTREDLAATFGMSDVDDPGTSYADLLYYHITGSGTRVETTKAIASIDFTSKTQYKVQLNLRKPGATSYAVRIVDDSNTANVLHEFTSMSEGTATSSLTSLPGWCSGVKTLRLQGKTGNSTDDIGIPYCSVYLK